MIRGGGPPPTRHALLRDRRRLERVQRGEDILGRRRRALVAELFRLARPTADGRAILEDRADDAYEALLHGLAAVGGDGARALGWPSRTVPAVLESVEQWGISAVQVDAVHPTRRSASGRELQPGTTGPATSETADAFEDLVDLLLDAASKEVALRRLGHALARASRQLNTLERRVEPDLEGRIARTTRILEEREREDHQRLKRFVRRRSSGANGPTR
ncbi:MAG: V-type ATP synthase subunit D [Gemmatimonadota bacterium]